MPYKNIVFVKMEKRLLNDHRWFGMSEQAQLIYIKLILIAAETYNKIPSSIGLLCSLMRTKSRRSTILNALKEIELNFPKFKKDADFYYFEDFHEKTNYIRECPSSAQVVPKDVVDKDKEEDKEKRIVVDEIKSIKREYFLDVLPITLTQPQIEAWTEWVDYRLEIKKKLTKRSAQKQIEFLLSQPNMIKCINQSIQNQWQGLFEIKIDKPKGTVDVDMVKARQEKEKEKQELLKIMRKSEGQSGDLNLVTNAFKLPEPIKEKKPDTYEKSKREFEQAIKGA